MAVSREDNVYDAHITYLDKDGPCIKVFAQPNNNTTFANNIERIIYKLRDKFNKHEVSPNTVKEILIGETCCAKFDDGNYYRAKVVNLDQLYSHRVVGVHFIDHGNSANVKPDDIVIFNRLLQVVEDEKKPGVEYLMVTPPLANEYLLQGLNVAQGKEWDDGTIKALRNKYCNTDVRCNLFEFNGKKIMRIVQYQSADPMSLKSNFNRDSSLGLVGASSERRSQLLKTEQPRLRHNLSMPPPSPISLQNALPSNRFPNLSQPPPMVRMADPNYGLNVQPFKKPGVLTSAPGMTMKHSTITNLQSTPVQNLQFSSEMLTPGVSHPVFVSHVEDGPCAFAVQIQSVVSSVLTKMMAEINNSDPKPITAPLNPGSICLARYSNDGSLCRAIVTGHMPDSKVKLYFADFGNTEVVAHSDIFQIPPEFVIPKVMSHRFTLANIRDKVYTDFEKKLFKDLVNNCSELLMKVTPPEANPLKQYCELFRNCKNIKVIMDEMVFEQPVLRYLPVPRPTVGSQEKVYVPFVLNPGRFFVQLSKNSFTLQQVMSCVANHCRTASPVPLVQQRVGEPCCAMYEDETWYRAEIIHLTPDNKAFVNFVDYGNQDDVELDKLRQATTELITSVKAQAIVCCLKGYETRYDVDEMISNRLEELILEQTLTMHVVGVTGNNVLIVQLQDSQGQDIFTLLEARPATVQPQVSQAVPASDGYEESSRAVTYNNSYQEKKFSDSQGTRFSKGKRSPQDRSNARDNRYASTRSQREENRKSWRSRDDGESAPRHKDGGGHWNENIKSDRRRDEEDHSRSTRIDPEDKGKSRSSREEGSGGWNSSSGGRFSREEDGGARSAAFGGSGRFNNSSSRFNREDGGGRVNQTDEERTYRKREEDSGGWRNKDRSEGGSWKDKENRGGWRDTGNESNQSGGYKERSGGGGGGWNDGSGDSGNKFNKDSGFKRGGYNQEERSSFRQGSGDGYRKPAPKTPKPNTVGGMPQPVVKIGTTQDTQVVYTTSPVEFYVQLTSSFDQLNELMERIATACESGSVEDMTGVQVKAGCLAKYSEDDTWYRAVTEEISFDSAKVLFVDYGNREAVPFDKIKVLPEDMTSLPVQAVKCRLYGVVDSAEVEAFSALVDAKNLKTQFVAKHFSTNSFEVVLVDEDSGSNINTAMGASADDVQTVLSKLGTTSLSHQQCASGLSLTTQMTWYISPAEFYLQWRVGEQPISVIEADMSLVVTELRGDLNTAFSHCISGDFGEKRHMSAGVAVVFANHFKKPLASDCVSNRLTCQRIEGGATVYGLVTKPKYNTKPSKENYDAAFEELIKDFKSRGLKRLVCSPMGCVRDRIPVDHFAGNLKRFQQSTGASVTVVTYNERSARVLRNGDSHKELMNRLQQLLADNRQPSQPKVMNTHPEFRAMMQSMQSIARSGKAKQTGDLSVGDFVIARFKEDKALYRALVKESGFVPKVQYVDYGNIETVESGSLWAMEEEYATLPIQALKCCLAGVRPTGDAWPKGGTTQLDGYFESDTLECSIVQEVDSQCLVRLTKEGQDVAQSIIDAGLALPDSDVLGSASELDPALLPQQLLPVSILRVEDNITFFVQPTAEDIELQSLETVAGEGIKCVLSSVLDEETVQLQQLSPSTNVIVHVESVTPNGLTVTLYDEEGQIIPGQTNDAPSVDKICPLPVLSTHQKVYVSHACPQGIYLQKSTFADHLSDLVQRLYDFYNETESVVKEWKTADFCSAKSVNDEQWYRAIILEPGDEEINVQYVDYGNCETVPVSNVRQLDKSFYTPHALCLKVSLHVTWTVPEDNLLEIAGDTEYSAVVLRGSDGWVVELIDGSGLSLTDRLVELGFATALENSPFKRVVEGGRFVEGSTINISVSFIDSPLQLWIFVGDDIEQIEALQDRLQEAAPRLPQLTEPTGIFAAKFSDDLWYRATLLENSTVRFIDYGNSDDINLSDIKELSADFLEPAEGFAVKVELPVGNFKPSATDRLNELLISPEINSEEEIVAHILSVNDSYIVADILKGGKSVVDILVGENLVTKVEKVCSGFISHLNSLNDFFIQETSCVESLESISNAMLNAEGFELVAQINEGDIVAALYTVDGLWYRARVTKKSEDEIVVLFIDYGNSAVATDFRSLPSDTIEIPPLSKRCTLQLPNTVTEWSETANEKFVELSAEGCTQFDVKVLNRKDIATVMLSCNGKCVTEELRPYCKQENEDPSIETSPIDLTGYDNNVYVSLLNSPNDFYVQVEGAEVELDNIREELADPSSFEKLEEITNEFVGKTIGAFIADHELWYRVRVINVTEVGTEVLLVDYGNTMTAIDFVVLPEHLESREPLAIHCSFGLKNFSAEALAYFTDVSGAGTVPFLMKIVSKGDPNIVSLILEDKVIENELSSRFGKSVADVIIEEVLEDIIVPVGKEPTTENIPEKSDESETTNDSSIIKTVFLIQVNSPSDFFLHTAEATQELEEISESLTTAADFPPADESSLSVGSILAGQIDEDDLWYRAKITDLSENEIKVLFIDYGTIATVAKVHSLPKDILSIPPLAMRCALSNIDGSNWSVNECEIFNKLANDDNVSFDLKILTEGEQNLVELFANGESVTKQLRAASGLAAEESSPEEKLPVDEHLVNEESASEETLLDPAPFAEASSDVQEPTHVKDFSENSEQSKAEEKLPVDEHFVNEESASEETLLDPAPFAEASSDVQEPTHVKDFSENSEQSKAEEKLPVDEHFVNEESASEETLLDPAPFAEASSDVQEPTHVKDFSDNSEQSKAEEKLSSPVKDLSNKMEQIKDEMRLSSAVKDLSEKMEQNADETKSLLNSNTHEVKEAVDKTPCSLMNQNNTLLTSFEINKNNDLVSEESVTENTSTQHIDEEKKDELADDKVQDNLYCDMREIAENLIMKTASYKVPSPKDSKSDVNGKHESDEDEDYDTPDEEKVSSEKTVSEITSPSSSENGHGNETCKSEISFEEVKTDLDPCGKIVGESPVIHPSRSNIDEKLVPGCISSVHLEDSTKQS